MLLIQHTPDVQLSTLLQLLKVQRGVSVDKSTIWQSLHRAGYSRKKVSISALEQNEETRCQYLLTVAWISWQSNSCLWMSLHVTGLLHVDHTPGHSSAPVLGGMIILFVGSGKSPLLVVALCSTHFFKDTPSSQPCHLMGFCTLRFKTAHTPLSNSIVLLKHFLKTWTSFHSPTWWLWWIMHPFINHLSFVKWLKNGSSILTTTGTWNECWQWLVECDFYICHHTHLTSTPLKKPFRASSHGFVLTGMKCWLKWIEAWNHVHMRSFGEQCLHQSR